MANASGSRGRTRWHKAASREQRRALMPEAWRLTSEPDALCPVPYVLESGGVFEEHRGGFSIAGFLPDGAAQMAELGGR